MVFPSCETLLMSIRSGRLYLPLKGVEAKIREAFLEPKPSVELEKVWVQISSVPKGLKVKERLMATMIKVGGPVRVGERSLKASTVRMQFQCRHPDRIKGSVQIFVNGEGYNIGLKAELGGAPGAGTSGGPPKRPPAHEDSADDTKDRSVDDEGFNKHRKKHVEAVITSQAAGKGAPTRQRGVVQLPLAASAPLLARSVLDGETLFCPSAMINQFRSNPRGPGDIFESLDKQLLNCPSPVAHTPAPSCGREDFFALLATPEPDSQKIDLPYEDPQGQTNHLSAAEKMDLLLGSRGCSPMLGGRRWEWSPRRWRVSHPSRRTSPQRRRTRSLRKRTREPKLPKEDAARPCRVRA